MKQLAIILILGILMSCEKNSEKIELDTLSFKKSTFIDGIPYRTKTESYKKSDDLIDLYFFKRHYNEFYHLPKELINNKLKGEIMEKWAYEDRPKDWKSNWTNTYEYDVEGKLISYSFSSCQICSQLNYRYELKYNQNNQIVKQINVGTDGSIYGEIMLEYDSKGNIVKLKKYAQKKQKELIIELNAK